MANKQQKRVNQPYSNMPARLGVLIEGFVLSLASAVLVLVACLYLFVPSVNVSSQMSPSLLLTWLLVVGIALGFVGTVFTVAGANTAKALARFSMLFSTLAFIIGAALLVIILLFRTVLPLDAIDRLGSFIL